MLRKMLRTGLVPCFSQGSKFNGNLAENFACIRSDTLLASWKQNMDDVCAGICLSQNQKDIIYRSDSSTQPPKKNSSGALMVIIANFKY